MGSTWKLRPLIWGNKYFYVESWLCFLKFPRTKRLPLCRVFGALMKTTRRMAAHPVFMFVTQKRNDFCQARICPPHKAQPPLPIDRFHLGFHPNILRNACRLHPLGIPSLKCKTVQSLGHAQRCQLLPISQLSTPRKCLLFASDLVHLKISQTGPHLPLLALHAIMGMSRKKNPSLPPPPSQKEGTPCRFPLATN